MKETLINKVFEYVKQNPNADNEEIANNTKGTKRIVSIYLKRLEARGKIEITEKDGTRTISTRELENKTSFKQDTYEILIDRYLDDFEEAENYMSRLEIGKMIMRIMEKM